jgi:hypothetical protein
MNIGGSFRFITQAEILTTTGRSRASAVVAGEWRAGLALPQFIDREQRILQPRHISIFWCRRELSLGVIILRRYTRKTEAANGPEIHMVAAELRHRGCPS